MITADAVTQAPTGWLPWVIAGIATVLGGGGLAALIRSGREGSKILVDAAQGAVIVQTGVIDNLRKDLTDARAEIAELRSHVTELNHMREQIRGLEHDNEVIKAENVQLKERVRQLEGQV
jgi:cell division protein FtsB